MKGAERLLFFFRKCLFMVFIFIYRLMEIRPFLVLIINGLISFLLIPIENLYILISNKLYYRSAGMPASNGQYGF